ncbi:LPXTG cell wall anchor domain-containing protein [Listeria sp. FSL L7-1517]|uniref:InlB B-repeat-containing protein n=1 Tax=Listeria immobilis TaxID=2713502 RepID=UPI00164ED66F|nr:InlB B-repeat-containing protein [Listeria immobilis]MBC6296159.1 LPXTG cell wall anchor domain-containing protein [Listeria immobilis]
MKKTKHILLSLIIVTGTILSLCIGKEAQAESISQPTPIDQIFPDTNLAKLMQKTLGKSSTTDNVSQDELDTIINMLGNSSGIQNLEGMQYLNNIQTLDLSYCQISNITPLANLTSLTSLKLTGNLLSDITPLTNLNNLTTLNLSVNQINDISPLANLTKLSALGLYMNEVSNISALANLTDLKVINLGVNQVNDISALANLSDLTTLTLYLNKISDISSLSGLNNLKILNLGDNMIGDINSLAGMAMLEDLMLSNNQIEDISSLSGLSSLTDLHLSGNQIKDISPLAGLTNLIVLDLQSQTITNPPVNYQTNLVLPNNIIDETGAKIVPNYISNNGTYADSNITWDLPTFTNEVNYSFDQDVSIANVNTYFSGTVSQPLEEAFTVIYDVDGVKTSEANAVNQLLTEPTPPTKEGYTFIGWYDAQTGGNKWDFANDTMPANDITLYAQFNINDYQATFNVDGSSTTQTITYQNHLQEPAPPTKEGYIFTGWYDAQTGGNKWDFANDTMPANDITLYAQFNKNSDDTTNNGDGTNNSDDSSSLTPPISENSSTPPTNGSSSEKSSVINSSNSSPDNYVALPTTGDKESSLPIIFGLILFSIALFTLRKINNIKEDK